VGETKMRMFGQNYANYTYPTLPFKEIWKMLSRLCGDLEDVCEDWSMMV